ncbi:hypothetical protein [Terracidiphilus sp.]|jgi:hypothetical protein|uniref:hypothetical protein n=1 Tax=Terracidiphilus sp. TaxID=1964191 RepID=UPI003C280B0B
MGIAPIPNLIPVRVSAPSAAPSDVPTTQAIDFRRQQNEDDATYTPSGSEEENQHSGEENDSVYQILQAATETILDELDDSGKHHTISVFA